MEYLHCAEHNLIKLNVSNNSKLKHLYCYNNKLSNLDISNNLDLYGDDQQCIVSDNTPLTKLAGFDSNKVSDLEGGSFVAGKIHFNSGSDEITYKYDCGQGKSISCKFVKSHSNKCSITFDSNGGTGIIDNMVVDKDSKYKLPTCEFTAPEGKIFERWDLGNVGDEVTISSDITIKALWKDKQEILEPEEPSKPEKPSTPSKPEKPNKMTDKVPKTGDESSMLIYTLILLLSLSSIGYLGFKYRKIKL